MMRKIIIFFITTLIGCACSNQLDDCALAMSLPNDLGIQDLKQDQFYQAKWIIYKANIALGASVQAGMPGSDSLAAVTGSLAELDLSLTSVDYLGKATVYTFEFKGGIYPSDHPYYNTIKFFDDDRRVEISEFDRFSWLVPKDTFDVRFEQFIDTTKNNINQFLICYPSQ